MLQFTVLTPHAIPLWTHCFFRQRIFKLTLLSHTADIIDNAFPKSNYLPIIRIKKMSVIRPSG